MNEPRQSDLMKAVQRVHFCLRSSSIQKRLPYFTSDPNWITASDYKSRWCTSCTVDGKYITMECIFLRWHFMQTCLPTGAINNKHQLKVKKINSERKKKNQYSDLLFKKCLTKEAKPQRTKSCLFTDSKVFWVPGSFGRDSGWSFVSIPSTGTGTGSTCPWWDGVQNLQPCTCWLKWAPPPQTSRQKNFTQGLLEPTNVSISPAVCTCVILESHFMVSS